MNHGGGWLQFPRLQLWSLHIQYNQHRMINMCNYSRKLLRRVFPKNFYQIQLSTSSTKHLLHLSYIHFICINFIYITYITYIINTINRNLTSTYLLQNSHNVIYKEFLHRTCYTGVLTQKLFTGVALHIFCKGVATEELLHRSSLPGDLITCIWTPTSLLLLTFYILSLMAAGASSSSPTSSLSSDAHPHPHPYIYIGKLE